MAKIAGLWKTSEASAAVACGAQTIAVAATVISLAMGIASGVVLGAG